MDRLDELESQSVYVLREAYAKFSDLCMLWSVGKDSTALLWLARKAFFGHVPFPLVHIDTGFKIPEMIAFRDRLVRAWSLQMLFGRNEEALARGATFPGGALTRLECCRALKTEALKHVLDGSWPRYRVDPATGEYRPVTDRRPFAGVIVGLRADEEGSRSKERVFSPRDRRGDWDVADQPPEFWNQFKTDFAPGTHVRIHPLLDWTEVDIWNYIDREAVPVTELYFDRGEGRRYRSLGCAPCTGAVTSTARTVAEIVAELTTGSLSRVAERSGRAQDEEDGGGLERLRSEGYM
ncbi:MAG: sulfate adenylyltransferase subunit 2 [Planctomycetes bacterium]|nr:sulfate adenylyltransferase subunit 2 [Planctomycetota bacterium]